MFMPALLRMECLKQQAALLVVEHTLKQQRRRRAARAAVSKRCSRRGGWHPKPRSGDLDAMSPLARWEHDVIHAKSGQEVAVGKKDTRPNQ